MNAEPIISDQELRREAKRIAREQRIPYTKAIFIAYKSLRLGDRIANKGEK